MFFRRIVDIKALMLAAAALLCGCSDDNAPSPVSDGGGEADIVLTLCTYRSETGPASRAGGHETEAASAAENLIDIDGGDYRVLIFGKDGRLLERFIPTEFISVNTDDYSGYSVSGRITQTDFMGNADSGYEFQIMVLANWESLGGLGCYDRFELIPGKTFVSDIVSMAREETYQLTSAAGWRPFKDDFKGIPMFGLGSIKVSADQVSVSSPESPINVGEISMLRAMAKIEIIDNIAPADGSTRPEITGATVSSHLLDGTFVPDLAANSDWADGAIQVVRPTEPFDAVSATAPLSFFNAGKNTDDNVVYSVYVAEQDFSKLSAKVSVRVKADGAESDYNMQLAEYQGGKPVKPLESFLRNHIYRFEIVSVSPAGEPGQLIVRWTVCPMDTPDDVDIDFS